MIIPRLLFRAITRVSPRNLYNAWRLWFVPGFAALRKFRERQATGQFFPPFFFIALTDACNLQCRGCWITSQGKPRQLSLEDVTTFINSAKRQGNRFYILLGGEPFLYKDLITLLQTHRDCYFQIITNGVLISPESVREIARAGNATLLISVDGFQPANDFRRGEGVFEQIIHAMKWLKEHRVLFGIATTLTSTNWEEVLSHEFIRWADSQGAIYLWYYIYRPVGPTPTPELALNREQIAAVRRRLLALRKESPIILIDTYWDAAGRAVCPAAAGLGYHIGPAGDIELCPPLSFATATIRDNNGDLSQTIQHNSLLRDFRPFVHARTRGCVILEHPQDLIQFLKEHDARDTSGRDAYLELGQLQPRPSHHLPEAEIPEDTWLYRWLKKNLFFGLAAYG